MKCFVCGSETPGEVCNQCVRTERNLFHKEWDYKEGFLMRKIESYRIDVSSYRISGTGMISNSDKGLNGRVDAFNHFVGNVDLVEKSPCNGKDALMIHYKNPNTQMERYIFLLSCDAEGGVKNAIEDAKKDLRIGSGVMPATAAMPTSAAAPAPAAAPMSADAQLKLNKLKVLLNSGILSQEEYEREKLKLGL
ncbi:MAG: hypothetical protein IJ711_01225 [Lachnospiraceae bacterium]|nr:hypothetical protein [Lachnospiraceae bacterium]